MSSIAALQLALYFGLLVLLTKPLGRYMARVFAGEATVLARALGVVERGSYRLLGVDPQRDMRWTEYAGALLVFSLTSLLFSYLALRLQGQLPLNPQRFTAQQMPPDLAFN